MKRFLLSLFAAFGVASNPAALRAGEAADFGSQAEAAFARLPPERKAFYLNRAEAIARGPVLSRAETRDDLLGKSGKRTPGGAVRLALLGETRPEAAEAYAFAMADSSGARQLMHEMGLVAAAYRVTGEELYREYLIRQLREVLCWNPFQRPGYSLPYQPGGVLPPGGEGAWIGTGYGLHAIALTLDLLPKGALPAELEESLHRAMEREVRAMAADWQAQRPWFVREGRTAINQALVPVCGALTASIISSATIPSPAYGFARAAFAQGLSQLGADGTMNDGFQFALADSGCDLYITRSFLARVHDPLAASPFFDKFPRWVCFYFQPGRYFANAFDTFPAQRGNQAALRESMTRLAAVTRSPELHWIVNQSLGGPAPDLFGLLLEGGGIAPARPSACSFLADHSRMFIWRGGWGEGDSGLWLRGGNPLDFHAHSDRGHVNFIAAGAAALIEAGTPFSLNPDKTDTFDSVLGHNVLQVGDSLRQIPADAPITVGRADASGGEIAVEAGAAYPEAEQWTRSVAWEGRRAVIRDKVRLRAGLRKELIFRWHLPAEWLPQIAAENGHTSVRFAPGELVFPGNITPWPYREEWETRETLPCPEIRVGIRSATPLKVSARFRPDHTLKFRDFNHRHAVIEVRTEEPVSEWEIETTIEAAIEAAAPATTATQR